MSSGFDKRMGVPLSAASYDRLVGAGRDLWSAIQQFRKTHDVESLDLDRVFDDVRDHSRVANRFGR